tara:strand:+ start:17272 stop:17778 length:507 start_codon:yes stop_codon:yes gene_type:complete
MLQKFTIPVVFLLLVSFGFTQEISPAYKNMIERKYNFPTIPADSVQAHLTDDNYILLDTRENEEYEVSHLPGAIDFGYDHPNYSALPEADTSKTIVVYCSIGVRSENIAKVLKKRGFTKVYNMYGGIFLWADQFRPMEDDQGSSTKKVHGYNKFWGRWIEKAPVVYGE